MSRLYGWISSDMRRTDVTIRGNERLRIKINYGSKYNSKGFIELVVSYPKDSEKPKYTVVEHI